MDVHAHIQAWIDGNDRAFRNIFDHYYPRLYSAALKMNRSSTASEELVMNVFLNIWKYRSQVHTIQDFSGYLFGILRNQVVAAARSKVLAMEDIDNIPAAAAGITPPAELSFKELETRYRNAVNRLPQKQKEVFLLSRDQGFSQQEIARQHNISINTVNNHIKAALKLIREDLRDYQYFLFFIACIPLLY
ncbi:RNA polymerase sigma factor [Chitinophaga sp. 22620]|uniref:RNA polymerase sigma factor n=1 Tax=Chitinophaga sp. 22620 TaxID=3453952 RepID=UPI003F8323AE